MVTNLDYSQYPHPCLLKITAGVKYIFIKTKSVSWLFNELNLLQNKYVRQGVNPNNIYLPLIEYMHHRKINEVKVDVLVHSENGYEILKEELKQLREHYGAERCLNVNSEPVIPQWKPATKDRKAQFNWLTQNQFLNYKKLQKSLQPHR